MKVQLSDGRARLRVDEAEFAGLLAGETVVSKTAFPGGTWIVRLVTDASPGCAASLHAGVLSLRLSRAEMTAYQSRLPCREGVTWVLAGDDGVGVRIEFEVDVRDSTRLRGPRRRHAGGATDDG